MLWSAPQQLLQSGSLTVPPAQLPMGWHGLVTPDGLALTFERDWQCLSSAVVNGGLVHTGGLLNMHLREDCPLGPEGPVPRLNCAMRHRHLPTNSVGLMTGAWMQSLRVSSTEVEDHLLVVLLTAGLSNVRRAGDHAEQRSLYGRIENIGTINMALASTVALTTAAMAETLTTLTEAKSAVLQDKKITSPVSGGVATGTGTDATAVLCPPEGEAMQYTGKHTRFGEVAAQLVQQALSDSLAGLPAGMHIDAG